MRIRFGFPLLISVFSLATPALANTILEGKTPSGEHCQIIEAGSSGPGTMTASAGGVSTSVSAGNGQVSGTTSSPAGSLVTGGAKIKFGSSQSVEATAVNSSSGSGGAITTASANGRTCVATTK